MFKSVRLSLSEDFPALRFCAAAVVAAFTAVVSVYKIIDISDAVSSGYTAPETMMLIFTDIINTVFIYTPLYLFIIESAVTRRKFGILDVVKIGGRKNFAAANLFKVLFYTLIFFALLFIINGAVSLASFPSVNSWSKAFAGTSAIFGYGTEIFGSVPSQFITVKLSVFFLTLFVCGMVNTALSDLLGGKEYAFPISAVISIGLSLLTLSGLIGAGVVIPILLIAAAVLFAVDRGILLKKDF
ncbi:MAG: hypothetical protein LBL87_04055 [Ruminococcus sp.]|jgi:hypothetical protein|nr:hypothetical protein [Ruminococcus sp.]